MAVPRQALASLVAAAGCTSAHDPAPLDTSEVPAPEERTDASALGEEAGAELTPEPPPSADRARQSASHSFCDRAAATFGVYFEALHQCLSGPRSPTECYGAEAFDAIYVLDARAGKIKGSLTVEVLSEDSVYGEGALAQLEGVDACSDLTEFVMIAVSRADARVSARVFDGRTLGGSSGFSLSTADCVGTLQSYGSYGDRVDVFALVRGDAPLRGPEHYAVAVDGRMTEVMVRLVDDCEQLLGHLAVWYRGEELTVVDAY